MFIFIIMHYFQRMFRTKNLLAHLITNCYSDKSLSVVRPSINSCILNISWNYWAKFNEASEEASLGDPQQKTTRVCNWSTTTTTTQWLTSSFIFIEISELFTHQLWILNNFITECFSSLYKKNFLCRVKFSYWWNILLPKVTFDPDLIFWYFNRVWLMIHIPIN